MTEMKPGGLTEAEKASLRSLLRYALTIFAAVAITLIVVALAASLVGFQPG